MKRVWLCFAACALLACGGVRQEEANNNPEKPQTPEEMLEAGGVLRMSWFGPGHKALEVQLRDRQCRSPYEFRSLQYGESLWVACEPDDRFHGGVLTKLNPNKKEAQSYWAFPQLLPLERIVGLAPVPNEQLAVLYQIAGAQEKKIYALGITGSDGWALPPFELGSFGHILGFSWNRNAAELVTTTQPEIEAFTGAIPISIISITSDGKRSERSSTVTCAEEGSRHCSVESAYRRSGESSWRVLVDIDHIKIKEAKEDGTLEASNLSSLEDLELSASGLLAHAYHVKNIFEPTGKVSPHPETPRGVESEVYEAHSSRYRMDGEYLRTYCLWEMVGSHAVLQNINGRLLYTDLVKQTGMLAITDATNPSQPKEKQVGPIAGKVFRWRCTDLEEGTFVPQNSGGYWLVGENGCFVPLPSVW